ncbi:alpha/beta fold hydrolase [Amycolatopsis sp. H20-H5]|uniref:alpha/beta fold hydrolase n=1 Tax=Amycolatopsis sp. H20-H5 TaxID=3046309 RepID=UPI002DB60363|nr:alpha/beta hydrolase [Amycolatopsis sp. H20-H5]MEC3976965.1 alpha/beta hydrolase [Amycolatopsis sp. H20-H5]
MTNSSRRLSYELIGEGSPIVLLPGGPGLDPLTYFQDIRLPSFQLVVLCPRGTGQSDPPEDPDGYRIAGYVEDLEQLRQHLNIERLLIYGSSHGASTALAYAARFPDHVGRLVVASGPARVDADLAAAISEAQQRFAAHVPGGADRLRTAEAATSELRTAATDQQRRAALRRLMDTYVAHLDAPRQRFLDRLCAAPTNFAAPPVMAAEMMSGLDLLHDAHRITAAALVIGGEFDIRVPGAHLRDIAEAIPNAHYVELGGAGHLVHQECPEWEDLVAGFFTGPGE